MESLQFKLVSPEYVLYDGKASMVLLPAAHGEMGVLPNHSPMIVTLTSGGISIFENSDKIDEMIFVAGGFANINESGCTVMADDGLNVKDINPDELDAYIESMNAQMAAELDAEERDNIEKNVVIAKAKIELFKRIRGIRK